MMPDDKCASVEYEEIKFMDIITEEEVEQWLAKVYEELMLENMYCAILFCDDETIRELNKQYLNKDYSTDVLSFSQIEGEEITGNHFLGDIVISVPYAAEQAKKYNHSSADEIRYLILHGVLHLLGYDHNDKEDGQMSKIEKEIYYKLTGDILE